MSQYNPDELALFLAGVISEVGEVRVPVASFNSLSGGVFIYVDEESDEIVFSMEEPNEN